MAADRRRPFRRRLLAVLTLGLSTSSRWNPLYRRYARRTTERNLVAGLKAMLILRGGEFVLDEDLFATASRVGAYMEPTERGVRYWIADDAPAPDRVRVLWGRRSG